MFLLLYQQFVYDLNFIMSWKNRVPRIYIFWIIDLFDLKKDIEENLGIKKNSLYTKLYRSFGHRDDQIDKIIDFVSTKIKFDKSKSYDFLSKKDFLETLKL